MNVKAKKIEPMAAKNIVLEVVNGIKGRIRLRRELSEYAKTIAVYDDNGYEIALVKADHLPDPA